MIIKEFTLNDFVDGKQYHTRGLLETFHPCEFCDQHDTCKRTAYDNDCGGLGKYKQDWIAWMEREESQFTL